MSNTNAVLHQLNNNMINSWQLYSKGELPWVTAVESSLSLKIYYLSKAFFSFIAAVRYLTLTLMLPLKHIICLNRIDARKTFFANREKSLKQAALCTKNFSAIFKGHLSTDALAEPIDAKATHSKSSDALCAGAGVGAGAVSALAPLTPPTRADHARAGARAGAGAAIYFANTAMMNKENKSDSLAIILAKASSDTVLASIEKAKKAKTNTNLVEPTFVEALNAASATSKAAADEIRTIIAGNHNGNANNLETAMDNVVANVADAAAHFSKAVAEAKDRDDLSTDNQQIKASYQALQAAAEQLTVNLGNEPLRDAVSDTTKIMKGHQITNHQSIASVINRAYLAIHFANNALTNAFSLTEITENLNEKVKKIYQNVNNNDEIITSIQSANIEAGSKFTIAIAGLCSILETALNAKKVSHSMLVYDIAAVNSAGTNARADARAAAAFARKAILFSLKAYKIASEVQTIFDCIKNQTLISSKFSNTYNSVNREYMERLAAIGEKINEIKKNVDKYLKQAEKITDTLQDCLNALVKAGVTIDSEIIHAIAEAKNLSSERFN